LNGILLAVFLRLFGAHTSGDAEPAIDQQRMALTQSAISYVGLAYRYGGEGASGYDCAGLMQALYREAGVRLPRTSYDQFLVGQPVTFEELQPGDLVFFRDTYKRGISHVGIYIGEGEFIHAANQRRGIVRDWLRSEYYAQRYAGARRFITDGGVIQPDLLLAQNRPAASEAPSLPLRQPTGSSAITSYATFGELEP
jgi:hypothetical protein